MNSTYVQHTQTSHYCMKRIVNSYFLFRFFFFNLDALWYISYYILNMLFVIKASRRIFLYLEANYGHCVDDRILELHVCIWLGNSYFNKEWWSKRWSICHKYKENWFNYKHHLPILLFGKFKTHTHTHIYIISSKVSRWV
jgi:hypothetical protein